MQTEEIHGWPSPHTGTEAMCLIVHRKGNLGNDADHPYQGEKKQTKCPLAVIMTMSPTLIYVRRVVGPREPDLKVVLLMVGNSGESLELWGMEGLWLVLS